MNELLKQVAELAKTLTEAQEKFKNLEEDVRDLRKDNAELRKENIELLKQVAALTARIAALEEGRKTVAAEVKAAMTEALTALELQKLREENERLRRNQSPPSSPSAERD